MADKNIYTVIVADDEDELREAVCTMIPGKPSASTSLAAPATAWTRWNSSSGWNLTCC